ncbi:hypothetical protein D3C84_1242790 [compost metagenome]
MKNTTPGMASSSGAICSRLSSSVGRLRAVGRCSSFMVHCASVEVVILQGQSVGWVSPFTSAVMGRFRLRWWVDKA